MSIRSQPRLTENLRLDAIALLLDIKHLQWQLEEANRHGKQIEVARLNLIINKKVEKAHKLLLSTRGEEKE